MIFTSFYGLAKILMVLILIIAFTNVHGQTKPDTVNLLNRTGNDSKDHSRGLSILSKNKFNTDSAFEILSSYRSITKESSAPDTNMCAGWTISKKNLYKIIRHSRLISGTEWDLSFDVLPCIIKGQLRQKGLLYDFEVNGGSWLYLKSKDTTVRLGDYYPGDQKYFIVGPMRD